MARFASEINRKHSQEQFRLFEESSSLTAAAGEWPYVVSASEKKTRPHVASSRFSEHQHSDSKTNQGQADQ
jgi:hypothetical protein